MVVRKWPKFRQNNMTNTKSEKYIVPSGTPDRTGASLDVLPFIRTLHGYGFGGMMIYGLGCFHGLRNILICVVDFCGVLYQTLY